MDLSSSSNSHGNGDSVREGVVICTPWSFPSTQHVLTVVNFSNQSPMLLEHLRTEFPLDRRNAELGLDAGARNAGGEATVTEAPSRRTGAAEPRHTEANAAKSFPSGLQTRSGDPRAAGGHLPHDACEARRTFGSGRAKRPRDLFVTKSKEGQRPTGEPHVYGWAAIMTALTTGPSTLLRRQAESGGIHVQRQFTGDSFAERLLEPVQKTHFRRTGSSGSVPWTPRLSPFCASSSKPLNARGAKEKFRPGSSGGNVRELQQMLDDLLRKLETRKEDSSR